MCSSKTFHNLPSPKHNAKDLRSFLAEYRKVREQMQNLTTVDDPLVIRSTIVRKLSLPTYEAICDYHKRYNFSLEQMDNVLQYMIGKLEQASLALVSQTNVKSVRLNLRTQNRRVAIQLFLLFRQWWE